MSIGDIFPESRGESKNQWEYGWRWTTHHSEGRKTIIHSENVHTLCHRCYSRGVIHPIMGISWIQGHDHGICRDP